MSEKLEKLNRLRVNAGKTELKSWKASGSKLDEAIAKLETEGFVDVLPGAHTDAVPQTADPEVAKALEEPKKDDAEEAPPEKEKPKVTKVKTALARGIDTPDAYTRHSREKFKDTDRADKKAERDKVKLDKKDQKQVKDEALARGQVDPKKDPEKAKRQADHIAEKQAKRKAEGKEPKPKPDLSKDVITIADLARELGKEPKIIRGKLRRPKYAADVAKLKLKGQDDWVFPKSARADLLKLIK